MKTEHIQPIEINEYKMPTKVIFGRNTFGELPQVVNSNNLKKILVVVGTHFKNNSKFTSIFNSIKKMKSIDIYSPVVVRSDFNTINHLVNYVQRKKVDCVIAIGGGAILDSVKCATILAENGGKLEDYLISKTKKIEKKGILNISIPTTSGSGSEVTPWAVVWGDQKHSLSSSEFMFPDVAIVDPSLTDSLSRKNTAEPGIDALVQAIEAYWSVNHNLVSDNYALDAISVIMRNLEVTANNPTKSSRDKMAWGSLLSGLAFSNTQTTICHSVSYPMTIHWKVSHGQATSITLPRFIEYVLPALDDSRRKKILEVIGVKDEKKAANKIRQLMQAIGLETKLSKLGIPKEGIGTIVEEGFDPARVINTPIIPTKEELKYLLTSIY